jgi:hypothetical protein
LSPDEAAPLLAEAADAGDPAGEALLLLGTPEVVEKARAWVVIVMEVTPPRPEGRGFSLCRVGVATGQPGP